jgi:hypothetical protein
VLTSASGLIAPLRQPPRVWVHCNTDRKNMQELLCLRGTSDYNVALPRKTFDDDREPDTRDAHRPVPAEE